MKFEVTQGHIKRAHYRDPERCPIALAINDKLKNCHARVGAVQITIFDKAGTNTKDYPMMEHPILLQFMKDADRGLALRPMEFELEYP
jgi:hypothetical protein